MLNKRTLFFASILLAVLFTGTAQADPLTITSGFFGGQPTAIPDRPWSLNIAAGPDFSLRMEGRFFGTSGASGAFALQPGETLSVRGFPGGEMPIRGILTLDGVTYDSIVASLSLEFTPVTFIVPDLAVGESVRITAPFSMTGMADIFNGAQTPPYPGPSHFDFVGSGTAFFDLSRTVSGGIRLNQVGYNFQDPAAVPEPATLVLLSTGLAGAIGAARKRRRVKNQG